MRRQARRVRKDRGGLLGGHDSAPVGSSRARTEGGGEDGDPGPEERENRDQCLRSRVRMERPE